MIYLYFVKTTPPLPSPFVGEYNLVFFGDHERLEEEKKMNSKSTGKMGGVMSLIAMNTMNSSSEERIVNVPLSE